MRVQRASYRLDSTFDCMKESLVFNLPLFSSFSFVFPMFFLLFQFPFLSMLHLSVLKNLKSYFSYIQSSSCYSFKPKFTIIKKKFFSLETFALIPLMSHFIHISNPKVWFYSLEFLLIFSLNFLDFPFFYLYSMLEASQELLLFHMLLKLQIVLRSCMFQHSSIFYKIFAHLRLQFS